MAFTLNADAAPFVPQAMQPAEKCQKAVSVSALLARSAPTPLRRHASQHREEGFGSQSLYQAPPPARTMPAQTAAVVSVRKMSAKGCAVVILRDQEVLERSVEQRVAVVDGVCVEVRRHTRVVEGDAVGGVFCAWGHRVERRVPVSEEGLEEYFNSLVGVSRPEGLQATPPFQEEVQRFHLASKGRLPLNMNPQADAAVPARLAESTNCSKELVHGLWDAKKDLDDVWSRPPPPMGRSILQRIARDQLFPFTGKDAEAHENRAGDKLAELANAVGLLDNVPAGAAFLDLCGGPGAWSQYLLAQELRLRGFGFTLRSGVGGAEDWQAEAKDDWYGDLLARRDWQALWGSDGSGDLLKPGNLEHFTQKIKKSGGVFLCVADGGFSDKEIPPNCLELYFYRLFLAELLTAASCLKVGGRFVCKLYSSYSSATSSLLFLTTRLFESVSVVKPKSSRVSGPERYLVAFGFRGDAELKEIKAALARSHQVGGSNSLMHIPLLTPIVSADDLNKDCGFSAQLGNMSASLCSRQTQALRSTLDRADFLEEVAMEAASHAAPRELTADGDRRGWVKELAVEVAKEANAQDDQIAAAPRRRGRHNGQSRHQ